MTQMVERFLALLYGELAGYIEVVAGVTRSSDSHAIDLVMRTRRWLYYDPQRPDLTTVIADYTSQLAEGYGNVYVSSRLYTKQAKELNTRSEEYVKPGSRVIFVDDAPADPAIPYSFSVRTSEGSRHGYFLVDKPVTKDDARRAAAALGGDPSGVDLTQLVRIPSSYNTKNHGRFPVELESGTGAIYTLTELRRCWPAVPQKAVADIGELDWPEVEIHLTNIEALLGCARSRLIKPSTQTGRILAGELLSFPINGRMDDSTSMNATAAAMGFYLRGYPDNEIAAVVYHLYERWGTLARKGTRWVKGDIERILGYVHAKKPDVRQSPTRYSQTVIAEPIAEVLPISRARHDRPQRFDPASLYAYYQAHPEVCGHERKRRATTLEISTATLDRLEGALRQLGLIEIVTAGKGRAGRVVLQEGVINIPLPEQPSEVLSAAAPEEPFPQAASRQNTDRDPQCIGDTHTPPETPRPPAVPAPQPRTLAEAVALVLGQVDRQEFGRQRLKIVRQTLAVLYGYTDTDAIRAEIKRQESIFTKERRECWQLPPDQLVARIQARIKSFTRNVGKRSEAKYRVLLEVADEVRQRRGIEMPAPAPRKEQRGWARVRSRGGVVSPQPTLVMVQPDLFTQVPEVEPRPPVPDGWGLIARLKARAAATL